MSSLSTLEELTANVTWYLLNSNAQDPMYIYMGKLEADMKKKTQPPKTNFTTFDPIYSVYVDTSPILRYGNYSCSVPGKEAYVDSVISCLIFQLPFFLENIHAGYIGFGFVIPIMLISIFGGIQESYRWFILHQAIWDLFVCYDFICSKPTTIGWFGETYKNSTTCFYYTEASSNLFIRTLGQSFRGFLKNGQFIPIFLIAFSRFLAMYSSKFYRNFTKNVWKIILFLFVFNLFFIIIFCFHRIWMNYIYIPDLSKGLTPCTTQFCPPPLTIAYCYQNTTEYFQCTNRAVLDNTAQQNLLNHPLVLNFSNVIAPGMFLFADFCVGFLFYKIASQLKFQLKTNRESFIQTIKISTVVAVQCFFTTIIFVITGVQKYLESSRQLTKDGTIYYSIPGWLFFLQYSTTTTSLNVIRVLLDSFVVLVILNAYSSCLIKMIKFFVLSFTNPKMAMKTAKLKFNFQSNKVSVISIASKPIKTR